MSSSQGRKRTLGQPVKGLNSFYVTMEYIISIYIYIRFQIE